MTYRRKLLSAIHGFWPPKPRPLILMYHRIADDPIDHWGLAVSSAHFEEQLEVLRRTRRPFSLEDFVRHLSAGTLPQDAVAITFDDGYVDNLVAGKPRLAAADVPATVFLATGYLDGPGEFWWDELCRLVLAGQGPRNFELVMGGRVMHVDLGVNIVARVDGTLPASKLKVRQAALTSIWEALRRLNDDERQSAMIDIRSILRDRDGNVDRGRAMTCGEVRDLVSDGLVTIGAHTVTHPLLPELENAARHHEITKSKSACEALIGAEVASFAYPFGGLDDETCEAVSAAGFAFACSTRHASADSASDLFALPRVQVCNWTGDVFQRALHHWSAATR
jgi:peptidoglycan/xylan/chitin deacetylase (PgdA/CDA1 family)